MSLEQITSNQGCTETGIEVTTNHSSNTLQNNVRIIYTLSYAIYMASHLQGPRDPISGYSH